MNTNLLHLNTDILNIIVDYVKKDNHDRNEKLKQDILEYVDIKWKWKKESKEEKYDISRRYTRIRIWRSIDEFWCNQFGNLYFYDEDRYDEINKIYHEHLKRSAIVKNAQTRDVKFGYNAPKVLWGNVVGGALKHDTYTTHLKS